MCILVFPFKKILKWIKEWDPGVILLVFKLESNICRASLIKTDE
mgnify:CR=1 FL=1